MDDEFRSPFFFSWPFFAGNRRYSPECRKMKKLRKSTPSVLLLIGSAMAGESLPEVGEPDALRAITPIGDIRTRYEFREEDPFDPSHAITTRARLGLKTREWNGWSALAEMEGTYAWVDDYRSNPTPSDATSPYVPGNTVIFDPENFELNRGWVQYAHEDWAFKVGRQRIVRNNQAMVGTVGWRQNEQTFDAASFTYAKNDFEFSYAYSNRAQRIFGNDGDDAPTNSPLKNFEGDFHFLDGSVKVGGGKLSGYAYLVDIDNNVAVGRTNTFGAIYEHSGLHVEAAWQDGKSALVAGSDYDAFYGHLKYNKKAGGAVYGAGFEYLEENFKTPFATVHAFNGFADAFILQRIGVVKLNNYQGLGNFYLSYVRPELPWDCKFLGFAHYFVDDGLGDAYGWELDAALVKRFNEQLTATLKSSFFFEEDGPGNFGDINQVSFQFDYSF
jgi:hypothetical protein